MSAQDWLRDIASGMPPEMVVSYARKHLAALSALPHSPDRDAAVSETLRFIEGQSDPVVMPGQDFVALAERILAERGVPFGQGRHYQDEAVTIFAGIMGLSLKVVRRDNNNPVTMVSSDVVIRHHGEHVFLVRHMQALVEGAV